MATTKTKEPVARPKLKEKLVNNGMPKEKAERIANKGKATKAKKSK